jgi:D-proline reductase (dithiol) PrdB
LDHQSVGLIARTIEEAGIATVYLGSCRDMMARVKAPRNVFVNFPLGHQCGKPNDEHMQNQILRDTLNYLAEAETPGGIKDLPYEWHEPFDWACYLKDVEEMITVEGQPVQDWKPKK